MRAKRTIIARRRASAGDQVCVCVFSHWILTSIPVPPSVNASFEAVRETERERETEAELSVKPLHCLPLRAVSEKPNLMQCVLAMCRRTCSTYAAVKGTDASIEFQTASASFARGSHVCYTPSHHIYFSHARNNATDMKKVPTTQSFTM